MLAAKQIAARPPDPAVAARADAAAHAGPWRHGYASVNGVKLHYAEMGSGPLVILLHGFPECWYEWRHVMTHLAPYFHVVAPDMRGYNWSDKPSGVGEYKTATVAQDIVDLIEALGESRAYIVGHDWGGAIAWYMGMHHGTHINKLVVANAPHPAAFERELKRFRQLGRSWYVLFFQLPWLPEASIRLALRSTLQGSAATPGAFTQDALDVYMNNISQPGVATAMINYYRATFRQGPAWFKTGEQSISMPTLLLWGMKDFALLPELTEGLEEWIDDLRVVRIPDSGHWVPEEKPGVMSDNLIEFLS